MSLPNIDTESFIIYLQGEVDVKMYEIVVKGLSELNDADYITFVLNTEGGDLYQALAIYDLIKLSSIPNKILCCGPVMSAGAVILCASEMRVATKNTQFMVHYGEEENDSPMSVRHNKQLYNLMKNIIGERVNISQRKLTAWFNKDTYLTTKEALECGLITRIAGE